MERPVASEGEQEPTHAQALWDQALVEYSFYKELKKDPRTTQQELNEVWTEVKRLLRECEDATKEVG